MYALWWARKGQILLIHWLINHYDSYPNDYNAVRFLWLSETLIIPFILITSRSNSYRMPVLIQMWIFSPNWNQLDLNLCQQKRKQPDTVNLPPHLSHERKLYFLQHSQSHPRINTMQHKNVLKYDYDVFYTDWTEIIFLKMRARKRESSRGEKESADWHKLIDSFVCCKLSYGLVMIISSAL